MCSPNIHIKTKIDKPFFINLVIIFNFEFELYLFANVNN